MAWFLNPALTRFRDEVNARWPGRDKTSDGTIGDAAHASRSSDHNPDPDGSVDAWDMDVDGVDVALLKQVFQGHEASKYWVHNDQICFRDEGWRPRSYAYAGPGRNRHDKHCHWNSRESHENSAAPWFPQEEDDDMAMDQKTFNELMDGYAARLNGTTGAQQRIGRDWAATVGVNDLSVKVDHVLLAIAGVDEEVVAKFGAGKLTPAQKADLLRPVLGADASAVGALLAQ